MFIQLCTLHRGSNIIYPDALNGEKDAHFYKVLFFNFQKMRFEIDV